MPVATGTSNLYLARDTEVYLAQPATGAAVLTPTAATTSAGTTTITVTHSYQVGDLISLTGADNPLLNTVHRIATVSTTVSFTFANAITGGLTAANLRIQKVNLWRVNTLTGYNFSQTSNSSEVSISEMLSSSGVSRRGIQKFTDSYAPAEWSLPIYIHPRYDGSKHVIDGEALWANLVGVNSYNGTTWAVGYTSGGAQAAFDLEDSNVSTLGEFDLYFVSGAAKAATNKFFLPDGDTFITKVNKCVVNTADINFDVEGIATVTFAGFGGLVAEVGSLNASNALNPVGTDTVNLIRNRLTAVTLTSSVSGGSKNYNITLTGGSININNNVTYLTPETLGIVNQPIGHVTGNRSVSGTFTCYIDEATNGSKDLFNDLARATTVITNSFATDIYIGGKSGIDAPVGPGLQFKMGQVNFDIPTIQSNDIIGLEIAFTALPTTLSAADEITKIAYVGI